MLTSVGATGLASRPHEVARVLSQPVADDVEETPLPGLRVFVDGKPARLGLAIRGDEGPLFPVREAIGMLSGGSVRLETAPGSNKAALLPTNGTGPRFSLPVNESGNRGEAAVWVVQNGKPTLMMDIYALAGVVGASVEPSGDGLYITTPAAWCRALGLGAQAKSALAGRNLVAQMGCAPPARSVLLWVRPSRPAFVQLFWMGAGRADSDPVTVTQNNTEAGANRQPRPLLGEDALGQQTLLPEPGLADVKPWAADAKNPARFLAEFYKIPEPSVEETLGEDGPNARFASYAAIVTTQDVPGGDVLAAIRSGKIAPGEWTVLGVRQRVGRNFVHYEARPLKSGETLEDVCSEKQIAPVYLRDINGLAPGEAAPSGKPILIPVSVDEEAVKALQKATAQNGPLSESNPVVPLPLPDSASGSSSTPASSAAPVAVVAKPGETMKQIAARVRAELADLVRLNDKAPGEEPTAGEAILVAADKTTVKPAVPSAAQFVYDLRPAVTKSFCFLRKFPDLDEPKVGRLEAGGLVQVQCTNAVSHRSQVVVLVSGKRLRGYVPTGALAPAGENTPLAAWQNPPAALFAGGSPTVAAGPSVLRSPAPPAQLPPNAPEGWRVATEAVRWENVPRYVWGGDNIGKGIDCSHFVAAVFARVGVPCPTPPVHEMERYGDLVAWAPGVAEDHGQLRQFPAGRDFRNLQPGDRVIFQSRPESKRDGNHHIGIYLGANYRGIPYAVAHCNSSHNTVSINSLSSRYLGGIFRYAVRGSRPRPANAWVSDARPTLPSYIGVALRAKQGKEVAR